MSEEKQRPNWQFCACNVQRVPNPAPNPSPALFSVLVSQLKEILANTSNPSQVAQIQAEGIPLVPVQIESFGESALCARWIIGATGSVVTATAVTMILCGQYSDEDEQARKTVTEELLMSSAPDAADSIKLFMAKLGEEPRPLVATVCLNTNVYDDPVTRYVASALGRAFFD